MTLVHHEQVSASKLSGYLRGLIEDDLARILALQPDACVEPVPTTFGQLADRLAHPRAVARAMREVDFDCVVVAQAMQVLGHGASRDALGALLGAKPELIDAAIERLTARTLLWPQGNGRLGVIGPLRSYWPAPFGLGRPIDELVPPVTAEKLRIMARGLGMVEKGLKKAELVKVVTNALSDPDVVRTRARDLPEQARELLKRLLTEAPRVALSGGMTWEWTNSEHPADVLVRSGLVVPVDYGVGELPREVGLALSDLSKEFELTGPPETASNDVGADAVARGAAAAASTVVGLVTALLDSAEKGGIAELRTGGVGVRERKRLAKALGCAEQDVTLWIDLAFAAGLLDHGNEVLAPTKPYDQWREDEPASRWIALATAWLGLEHAPTYRMLDDEKELPPPVPLASGSGVLRHATLELLAELGPNRAVDPSSVFAAICWRRPMCGYPLDEMKPRIRAAMAEAETLGVVASGALTDLGRALLAGDQETLLAAARAVLAPAQQSVTLQSDLTAVVTGEPSRRVTALLDSAADLETRGTARIWRFSPASVRRALDTGTSADELLTELAELATQGIPQPLEYLIRDVARRHGSVRVASAGCCVYGEDSAHLTEIAKTRSLADLKLRQVAPSVLLSAKPLAETLDRLRKAGFAPMGENVRGAVVTEKKEAVRAAERGSRASNVFSLHTARNARSSLPPAELARQLFQVDGGSRADAESDHEDSGVAAELAGWVDHLSVDERAVLADAIEYGRAVLIEYTTAQGNHSTRVVDELVLQPPYLSGWCHLREAERVFTLDRISSVSPA